MKREWMEEMQANMNSNENEMTEMKRDYEEKLKQALKEKSKVNEKLQKITEEKKTKPHIFNLNFDPQLSGKIVHILSKASTEIGNRKGHESDVCMIGPG